MKDNYGLFLDHEAEQEKKEILSEARKSADAQYQQIINDAKANASEIKTAAATEANREKNQIMHGIMVMRG